MAVGDAEAIDRAQKLRVLVSAASRHGATTEIAQAIGQALAEQGLTVTVIPPGDVRSLDGYDAVIIGSAVYRGHWLGTAKELVNRFGTALADRPVWLFSSGPVGNPSGKLAESMNQDPVDLPALVDVANVRDHRIFAGRLDRKHLSLPQRAGLLMFRSLNGDFRDWTQIRQWADSIAEELTLASSPQHEAVAAMRPAG